MYTVGFSCVFCNKSLPLKLSLHFIGQSVPLINDVNSVCCLIGKPTSLCQSNIVLLHYSHAHGAIH